MSDVNNKNINLKFIGKKFTYKRNNFDALLWYNSLININIENLFTPFFENMDNIIVKSIKNDDKNCTILYPFCFNQYYDDNKYFNETLIRDIFNNKKKLSKSNPNDEQRNIYNKFNLPIASENGIDKELLYFSRKLEYRNNNFIFISIFYKDYWNNIKLINDETIYDNSNKLVQFISERLPLEFIEYLYKINNLNFKQIIYDKINGVKEIRFNNYDLEIIFY